MRLDQVMNYGSAPKFAQKFETPGKLEVLWDQAGVAKSRVRRAVDATCNKVQAILRSRTQFGRGRLGSKKIEVSDQMPPEMGTELNRLSEFDLWLLANRLHFEAAAYGLSVIAGRSDDIGRNKVSVVPDEIGRSRDTAAKLASQAREIEDRLISTLAEASHDILGAYFPHSRRIELYWVPIWLYSRKTDTAIEDLAIVVLAHELAHFFTHWREDSDGRRWDTRKFLDSELPVVEGLAQFFTESVCQQLEAQSLYRCHDAFSRLLRFQSFAYTCFTDWAPNHQRRGEVIRIAMLQARCEAAKFGDFRQMVSQAEQSI
jgi:hypothetical protein